MNRAPDDIALAKAFAQNHEKHPNFVKGRFANRDFSIKHFAGIQFTALIFSLLIIVVISGTVTYAVEGFIMKNNNSLQDDLEHLMMDSENVILKSLFQQFEEGAVATAASAGSSQRPSARRYLLRLVLTNKLILTNIGHRIESFPERCRVQ